MLAAARAGSGASSDHQIVNSSAPAVRCALQLQPHLRLAARMDALRKDLASLQKKGRVTGKKNASNIASLLGHVRACKAARSGSSCHRPAWACVVSHASVTYDALPMTTSMPQVAKRLIGTLSSRVCSAK